MSYSPTIGRFLEMDPDEYIDGPNTYQLEGGNPIDFLDPSGTKRKIDWGKGFTDQEKSESKRHSSECELE